MNNKNWKKKTPFSQVNLVKNFYTLCRKIKKKLVRIKNIIIYTFLKKSLLTDVKSKYFAYLFQYNICKNIYESSTN